VRLTPFGSRKAPFTERRGPAHGGGVSRRETMPAGKDLTKLIGWFAAGGRRDSFRPKLQLSGRQPLFLGSRWRKAVTASSISPVQPERPRLFN